MQIQLASCNAVVVANAFNPSLFRERFLEKCGVLTGDTERLPGYLFTDQVVNLPTRHFTLLVLPQQVQLTPTGQDQCGDLVRAIIPSIVRELPHTPYSAAGLNFSWFLRTGDETLTAATRRLFGAAVPALGQTFAAADAAFGYFASKDVLGARMKLDVKPVVVAQPNEDRFDAIQCVFNFHADLDQETAAEQVASLASCWEEYYSLAETVAKQLSEDPGG